MTGQKPPGSAASKPAGSTTASCGELAGPSPKEEVPQLHYNFAGYGAATTTASLAVTPQVPATKLPQLTGSRANAEAGMLEVWAARTLTLGVPTDGCGVAVQCCWPSKTFPRSKRDMQCQGASGYTPGSGGLGL